MPRLTQVAHDQLAAVVQPGSFTIDATAGNGHDTAFLAKLVGKAGKVMAIDKQLQALINTDKRLIDEGLRKQAILIQGSHADMLDYAPTPWIHGVKAIVFNLGYLPGSDKSVNTSADSTHAALHVCKKLLAPGGLISILIYRGHDGGHDEESMIIQWVEANADFFAKVEWNDGDHPTDDSPRLLSLYY
ncbi:class I SAM-dependent methyltransferase [Cerasicoccus fimbriatus]|uniref:class I SAM-dependent methyltransferase n=1 Tax=Cerasicoccus fimbriatus TaxID=3014554 RepID=UPI0022B2F78E|nr:class I SAM-dependent methyltransferase [Cerasicoccus sp. TK19100]